MTSHKSGLLLQRGVALCTGSASFVGGVIRSHLLFHIESFLNCLSIGCTFNCGTDCENITF